MNRPILIVAHPGHELRLTAWMERERPLVCILTDGSGGGSQPRTGFSRDLITRCGAEAGPVFGPLSDRAWYAAILAGDTAPFLDAAERIAAVAAPGALVVADPVEGYNPMHDLCAAVGDRVAALAGGPRATYPLMVPRSDGEVLRLDAAAEARKREAVEAYTPMLAEAEAAMRAEPEALLEERLLPAGFDWPPAMRPAPIYELFGQALTMTGLYAEAIAYGRHVRPIALRLRDVAA